MLFNTTPIQTYNPISSQPATINSIIDNFIASLDVKENSKKNYKRTLKLFFAWITVKGYASNIISRVHILEYKNELHLKGKTSLTVASYMTSVRRFYEWVEASGFGYNVSKGIKSPKRKQQFRKSPLSQQQVQELLNHSCNLSARDNAIINLLLRTGLRTIEVSRANVEDIVYKADKRILRVHGKGRDEKDNFVILSPKTYLSIENYLNHRQMVNVGDALFISNSNNSHGRRLSTRTISHIVKKALKAIGLNNPAFTAHSLRHTTAVNILRVTNDISQAQSVLRHTNPATTQIYTATIEEEQRLKNATEEILDNVFL